MCRTDNEREIPVITKPFPLSKSVYNAFGPFEKLAAQALEEVGDVQIVDDNFLSSRGAVSRCIR